MPDFAATIYSAKNFAATAQLVAQANAKHKQARTESAFKKKKEIWYGSALEHAQTLAGPASAYLTRKQGQDNDDVYQGGDAILERTAKRRENDLLIDPTELKRDPVRWCGNCENR